MLGTRAAGELGVPRLIGPSPAWTGARHAHEEVGEADPRIIGERRLIDKWRAARHGLRSRGDPCRPCADRNPNNVATVLAQACEAGLFVLGPLTGKECAVRVLNSLRFRAQAAVHFDVPGPRGATAQE